jgi:hypothetical protein
MAKKESPPTVEVRFEAPNLRPETIPLRYVADALAAVQDLASGRDPYETDHVPPEQGIGLVDVRSGSAVYSCFSRAPELARSNLTRVGTLLSANGEGAKDSGLVAALPSIESLSDIARLVGCQVSVFWGKRQRLFSIQQDAYDHLASRVFLKGDTTVIGTVERVGGATRTRCLLRVPGRKRGLYCDVKGKDLARRLGLHLYQTIAASGTATWIHRNWRIYRFTIREFSQPRLGDSKKAIKDLRNAGLAAWDKVADPESLIRG